MFEKEAGEYADRCACLMEDIPIIERAYKTGAEFGYNKAKIEAEERIVELEELVEKYRQAVDKCLHITFMGSGCEVHTVAQYATLVDGYLIDVEGLAKWKN